MRRRGNIIEKDVMEVMMWLAIAMKYT